jgi:hypothetical protein
MYYQNLPLYHNLIRLLNKLYKIVHQTPKEYKFTLGQEVIRLNWKLIDLFILAQSQSNNKTIKKETVSQLSLTFNRFKIRLRFLVELKLISLGRAAEIHKQTEEIGKMIGSWNKKLA